MRVEFLLGGELLSVVENSPYKPQNGEFLEYAGKTFKVVSVTWTTSNKGAVTLAIEVLAWFGPKNRDNDADYRHGKT